MSDKHLMQRAQAALSLAGMLVELSRAIRPRQEAWLLDRYGMTWAEAAASAQSVKDEMQQSWSAYWARKAGAK